MVLKKVTALVLTVVSLFMSVAIPVSAEEIDSIVVEEISPAYEIASNPSSLLSISGQTAYCTSKTGGVNAVSITVNQTLEKYSGWFAIWNAVDNASWTETIDKSAISVVNTKSGLSSGTYRLKSVFTLKSASGKTETITVYSPEKTVN